MGMRFTRRTFLQMAGLGGAGAALAGSGCAALGIGERRPAEGRVVVVGGGCGGATAAKYLKQHAPELEVTLVEPNPTYYTCFAGNWHLGGFRELDTLAHGYDALRERHGVRVVHDRAEEIDRDGQKVITAESGELGYDRLVMAPGITFDWDAVEGMDAADTAAMPVAWHGGSEYAALRAQLEAMPDGGRVLISAPGDPYRCPPGPYERASLIAHYLKAEKPRSKVLILDNKDAHSKQALFHEGWEELYGDMIEWVPAAEGGRLDRVSVRDRKLYTDAGFEEHEGDVINVIPPQKAGTIAQRAELVDERGWCPVDQRSFRSELDERVFVVGDASIAGDMPKSGHSANNQGKLVAATIASELRGEEVPDFPTVNTCYSLVAPDWGITVAAVYEYRDGAMRGVEGAGGLSPEGASRSFRQREAAYAPGWYASITEDIFG